MKIKAKLKKGKVDAKVMAKHPMLSYQEAERAKKKANFITYMTGKINGKVVYEMSSSQFLSKNPYVRFFVPAEGVKKGDKLEMSWTDLSGKTVNKSGKIK
jgi:sulfur-oxidizing protein SoxZ